MTRGDLIESITYVLTEGNAPGGTIEDFDIEAIADACHEVTGHWGLHGVPDDQFWAIVRQHDRTQADALPYRVQVTWHLVSKPGRHLVTNCVIQPGYSTEDDLNKMIAIKRGLRISDVVLDGIVRL